MTHASSFVRWMRPVAVGVLGALLAACGGGGGGGGESPVVVQKIDLTVANHDTVAHAVVGGALGIGGADIGLGGGVGAAVQSRMKQTTQSVRARPMAVASQTLPCSISGSFTVTVDDRDGSGSLTTGDFISVAFNQCSDYPGEMTNGAMSMEFLNVLSATDYDARTTFSALASENRLSNQVHRSTLDGTMLANYREPGSNLSTMRLTAEGEFTVALATPVFSDTATLASGFVQDVAEDYAAMRSVATVTGDLRSASAGGWVSVKTDAAVVAYEGDRFPRSGTLQVNGRTGEMHITAVDSTSVRCDLDYDDDGEIEDSSTESWEWMV